MDIAYVGKLSKRNNGVKYSLVRQDLFDRSVNAKRMKKNIPKKLWKPFIQDYKQKEPKKI